MTRNNPIKVPKLHKKINNMFRITFWLQFHKIYIQYKINMFYNVRANGQTNYIMKININIWIIHRNSNACYIKYGLVGICLFILNAISTKYINWKYSVFDY